MSKYKVTMNEYNDSDGEIITRHYGTYSEASEDFDVIMSNDKLIDNLKIAGPYILTLWEIHEEGTRTVHRREALIPTESTDYIPIPQ